MTFSSNANMILTEFKHVFSNAQLLYSERELEQSLDNLATAITQTLSDKNPLVLCVMNGAIVMTGKLLPRLSMPLTLDAINASRYQNDTIGSQIDWLYTPRSTIKNRCVLIVDDILDEGITLKAIYEYCYQQEASEVYSAVLIDKQLSTTKACQANFIGLSVPNRYVFGYGMDYKGYGRNANGLYACQEIV